MILRNGFSIISYYLPVMLDAIGVKDTNTKLVSEVTFPWT